MVMLPLTVSAVIVRTCKPCNRSFGIVSAYMVHQNIKHLWRIVFDNAHNLVKKVSCIFEANKI